MKQAQRRRLLKKEARFALKTHYRKSVLLSLFSVLCLSGCRSLVDGVIELFGEYVSKDTLFAFRLLFEFSTVLLTAPLFCGIFACFFDLSRENGKTSDIFFFYRNAQVCRSACLCGFIGRCALWFLDLLSFSEGLWEQAVPFPNTCESVTEAFLRIGFGLGELLLLGMAFFALAIFPIFVIRIRKTPTVPFGKILREARKTLHGAYRELFCLIVSFLPLFFLSYGSFTLLAIAYVLPYFLFTLCRFAAYLECVRFTLPCGTLPLYAPLESTDFPTDVQPEF